MKYSLKLIFASLVFGSVAAVGFAQTPKIAVVDMARLYDTHYKTEEQNAKLRGDEEKAQQELEALNSQGNALVEEYKELVDQTKNPALSDTAKAQAESDAQLKLQDIQRKQQEVASFRQNTAASLQQRIKTFRDLMLEEISKVATEVAKRQNVTILFDKAGPSLIGISSVIFVDDTLDITDAVMAEINKDRPAGAAAPAASGDDTPTVSFPGN